MHQNKNTKGLNGKKTTSSMQFLISEKKIFILARFQIVFSIAEEAPLYHCIVNNEHVRAYNGD